MEITSEKEFEEIINENMVVVDFFATWCGPCRMQGPVLEEFASKNDVKTIKVDVDKFPLLARKYAVMSIPTLILFKKGEAVDKKIGLTSLTELSEWV